MEPTEENESKTMAAFMSLAGMRGFPEKREIIKVRVDALMRLCWGIDIEAILDQFPNIPDHRNEERKRQKGTPSPYIGGGSDLKWLMETVLDREDFMPSHSEMVALYTKYLPPSKQMRKQV